MGSPVTGRHYGRRRALDLRHSLFVAARHTQRFDAHKQRRDVVRIFRQRSIDNLEGGRNLPNHYQLIGSMESWFLQPLNLTPVRLGELAVGEYAIQANLSLCGVSDCLASAPVEQGG